MKTIEMQTDQQFDDSPAQQEAEATLDDILAAFNASEDDVTWNIRIHRIAGNNKLGYGEPYLFSCSPEELPIDDRIRDGYGTGKYRARVYKNRRLYRSFQIEIEAALEPPKAKESENPTGGIEKLMEQQNRFFNTIIDRLTAPAPVPQINPMEMMTGMITALAGLNNLIPKAPVIENASDKAMEMFTKGIELAQKVAENSSGSGETGLLDIVKTFIQSPAMEGIVGGMKNNQQTNQNPMGHYNQAPQRIPQTGPNMVPPVMPPNVGQMSIEQIQRLIKDQIDYLCSQAIAGKDPALYAEWILDNMPPMQIQYMLNQKNIIGELTGINPAIGNHIPWFQQLLEAMREMMQADEADLDDTRSDSERAGSTNNDGIGTQPNRGSTSEPDGNY